MNELAPQNQIVAILMIVAFVVGALFNTKRFSTYTLVVLIIATPLYGTEFMPRELLGMTGLSVWNLVWFIAVLAIAPSAMSSPLLRRVPSYFSVSVVLFVVALALATIYAMIDIRAFPNLGSRSMSLTSVLLTGFLKPMQFLILGWMVYVHCVSTRNARPINRALLVSATIFGVLVVYYYFAGIQGAAGAMSGDYRTSREFVSDATGMNVNDIGSWATYGIVVALLMPADVGIWVHVRRIAVVMSFLAIVFSLSRTAFVAAPLVLLFALKRVRLKDRVIALAVFAVVIVVAAPLLLERARFGLEEKRVTLNEVSAGRWEGIWKPLWKDVEENPFIGNGRFAQLRSPSYPKIRLGHAHSLYLQILLDMGVVGLAIVISVIARLYLVGLRTRTMLPHLIMVMLIVGITGHSFYPDPSNYILWVVYGLSLAALSKARAQQKAPLKMPVANSKPVLQPAARN